MGLLRLMVLVAITGFLCPPASAAEPVVVATVAANGATPENQRAIPLGMRGWFARFAVTVESDEPCGRLGTLIEERRYVNGRLISRVENLGWLGPAGSSSARTWRVYGLTGEDVELRVVGRCLTEEGTTLSDEVQAGIAIPIFACRQGPLRVLSVTGRAQYEDPYSTRRFLRARKGDLLRPNHQLVVGRGATVRFGARACNGLRLTAFTGSRLSVGSYAKGSRGIPTTLGRGGRLLVRADWHLGAVETATASARVPKSLAGSAPRVSYEVRSVPFQSAVTESPTRVRVYRGALRVNQALHVPSQLDRWWSLRLREGFETDVRCSEAFVCIAHRPWRFR